MRFGHVADNSCLAKNSPRMLLGERYCRELKHRNLVQILGYCIEEEKQMLVYEYMPNKSLDFLIFVKVETETRCNGGDQNQLPEGDTFGAVSNGLWDNGAACGPRYHIRCINGLGSPCKDGSIVVTVDTVINWRPRTQWTRTRGLITG
ncbi:hypothetical protein Syun_025807 [Stephania yunnanensis]|uniref:Expansin-like EG45 domain-containing protein n=1 Tax=Stephania yunnanensis TaxID=152371 RepID=A0AAP0EXQ1_9MAGN